MENSLFEIADGIEQQCLQLSSAEAVLKEILRYFENSIEPNTIKAYLLVKNANHISILLYLLFELLHSIEPEIRRCIEKLPKLCEEV